MGKRSAATVLTVALTAGIIGISAGGASASADESRFVSKINRERTSRGMGSLSVRSDLVEVARRHSRRMAARGEIWHNKNLANEVGGPWTELGENVGVGPDVETLHLAFMQSPSHRANVLHRSYNQIGVGIAFSEDGEMYVTEVFAARRSTTTRTVTSRTTTTRRTTSTARPTSTASRRPATTVAAAPRPVPVPVPEPEPEPRTVELLADLVGD